MSDADAESDGALPDPPAPPYQLVTGTAIIDDLDAFLSALDEIAAETGAVVQAFDDADFVVSAAHLREATRLAARAIARDDAVARDPGVEILLYAAGTPDRPRARARSLGGEQRAVVLVTDFGRVPGADRPDADLDAAAASVRDLLVSTAGSADTEEFEPAFDSEQVQEFYDIGDREIAATIGGVAEIVRERVALLDVEK